MVYDGVKLLKDFCISYVPGRWPLAVFLHLWSFGVWLLIGAAVRLRIHRPGMGNFGREFCLAGAIKKKPRPARAEKTPVARRPNAACGT